MLQNLFYFSNFHVHFCDILFIFPISRTRNDETPFALTLGIFYRTMELEMTHKVIESNPLPIACNPPPEQTSTAKISQLDSTEVMPAPCDFKRIGLSIFSKYALALDCIITLLI